MRDKLLGPSAALKKPGEPLWSACFMYRRPRIQPTRAAKGRPLPDWFEQRKRQRNLPLLESLRGN